MNQFVLALGFGIVSASIIALGAVGFTLQFGISGVFNVSYGAAMTTAAYIAYLIAVALHGGIWTGLAAGGLAGSALGFASDRFLFSPFLRRRAGHFAVIMVALGLDIFVQNALLAIAGPGFLDYGIPPGKVMHFAGTDWTSMEIIIVLLAVAAMILVHLLLRHTRIGKAMRATSADPQLAEATGVNTRRTTSLTWTISGLLCGLGGVVLALNTAAFGPTLGDDFVLIVFAAAVVGGLGEPYGAMLGALIIGITTSEIAIVSPNLEDVAAFVVLALALLLRPGGLVQLSGRARRERVAA